MHIFSSMLSGYEISRESDLGHCTAVHTLNYEEHGGQLAVTSLSWNATGSVIAASYPFLNYYSIFYCMLILYPIWWDGEST